MCDFLIAVATDTAVQYLAAEHKSSEPYIDDAKEQLAEGLRTAIASGRRGPVETRLRALLVAGKVTSRLRRLALARSSRIELGDETVPIEIVDCGSELTPQPTEHRPA